MHWSSTLRTCYPHYHPILDSITYFPIETQNKFSYQHRLGFDSGNPTGKIPLGLKRKGLRIVVTGGAGFVGSHLVDRLIARGDSVIVVDNFFTGRKENVMHHFGNPNFELIRHDVVEPLLLDRRYPGNDNANCSSGIIPQQHIDYFENLSPCFNIYTHLREFQVLFFGGDESHIQRNSQCTVYVA